MVIRTTCCTPGVTVSGVCRCFHPISPTQRWRIGPGPPQREHRTRRHETIQAGCRGYPTVVPIQPADFREDGGEGGWPEHVRHATPCALVGTLCGTAGLHDMAPTLIALRYWLAKPRWVLQEALHDGDIEAGQQQQQMHNIHAAYFACAHCGQSSRHFGTGPGPG